MQMLACRPQSVLFATAEDYSLCKKKAESFRIRNMDIKAQTHPVAETAPMQDPAARVIRCEDVQE